MSKPPSSNDDTVRTFDAEPCSPGVGSNGMSIHMGALAGEGPCGAPDPYAEALAPDQRETYASMTADVDLGGEIRLIRTLLAVLAGNLEENHAAVARVAQTLLRAMYLHARHNGNTSQLQTLLDEAGERVIHDAQDE